MADYLLRSDGGIKILLTERLAPIMGSQLSTRLAAIRQRRGK
jgi:hypothetical protein